MINLGIVKPGSTIYVPFESFAGSTGAPITMSGFAVSDIKIFKNGSTTERASTSGFTLLDTDGIDFDSITGIHGFSVDLSDNTTADFYAAGADYFIVVSTITVDSQTISFVAARFSIGYQGALLDTTIATLTSQTSFTLTSGPAEDDALKGLQFRLHQAASAVKTSLVVCSAYTGSTKTVTLAAAPTFTIAAKDNISVLGMAPLQPGTGTYQISLSSGLVTLAGTQTFNNIGQTDPIPANVEMWQGDSPPSLTNGGAAFPATVVDKTGFSLSGTQAFSNTGTWTGSLTGSVGTVGGQTLANLDAAISSRMATFTLPTNFSSLGINASGHVSRVVLTDTVTTYTGNTPQTGDAYAKLPASPAAVGSAMTLTSGERTSIANEVEAQIIDDTDSEKVLQAITDKIASVNPSLDDLTLAGIASAVRTELTTELARIDAAISSRMATFVYTAPDNAGISAIQATLTTIDGNTNDAATSASQAALNTTSLPSMITANKFTSSALSNAPSGGSGSVIFTPMKAAVTNPRFTTKNLAEIPAGTAPADYWDITDGNDQPVNLSGKTIRFVVASIEDLTEDYNPFDDTLTAEYAYETGGSGITVSGDDDNRVTVQHDADNTATPGDYRYFLLNVTDNIMLAKGKMPVMPAALEVV